MRSETIIVDLSKLPEFSIIGNWSHITDEDIEKALISNLNELSLEETWEKFEFSITYGKDKVNNEVEISDKITQHHAQRIAKIITLLNQGFVFDSIMIEETTDSLITDGHHRLRAYQYLQTPKISFFITGTDDFINSFKSQP